MIMIMIKIMIGHCLKPHSGPTHGILIRFSEEKEAFKEILRRRSISPG